MLIFNYLYAIIQTDTIVANIRKKEKNMKTLKFNGNFIKTALRLAIPIAFQNLLTSCATLVDTAMVVGLGNDATSAMGVASRFSFLLNVICFGFASGCSALLSQYWGAGDRVNIRRSTGFAMTVAMGFGIVYTAALLAFPTALAGIFTDNETISALAGEYLSTFAFAVPFLIFSQIMCIALRSVESVVIPLVSSFVSVGVNIFFNYCFICGHFGFPALGLRGAAIGSVIGCTMQTIVIVIAVFVTNTPFRGGAKDFFSFSFPFVKKYFRIAAPVLLNETMWAIGTNVYVMVIARQGVENHAGYTLYENIQQLFFVFFVGICGAAAVMVGMNVGKGEHDEAYLVARKFAIMTPCAGVVLGGILIALRNPILSLFPIETETARSVASDCLLFYGCWIAIRMIQYTLVCGVFRAGGDTKTGCIYEMIGLYGVGIPAVLITGFLIRPTHFVVIIIVMFVAEDVSKGILCIRHFRSRKWIKQITDNVPKEENI